MIIQSPQYECGAQYSLNIFRDNGISYSWNTIYVGRKLKRLNNKEIENYAVEYLCNNSTETNEYITELAYGVKFDHEISNLLEKIFEYLNLALIKKGLREWELERLKWRYCIMMEINKNIHDSERLLDCISNVYCDFQHPEDMNDFIDCTSAKYREVHGGRQELVNSFRRFLEQEKSNIDNQIINPLSEAQYDPDEL